MTAGIKTLQNSVQESSSVMGAETVNHIPRLVDLTMPRYCNILVDAPSISSEEDVTKLQVLLTEKMAKFYEAEHNPERETSVACIPDSRVDICLYLLEPHQLPKVDIDAIVALGKSTPIVFLLGKADTMTEEETEEFRRKVEASLQSFNVPDTYKALNLDNNVGASAPEDQKAVQPVQRLMRIISSRQSVSPSPFYPVRQYSWGKVDAWSPDTSDVLTLKRVLEGQSLSFLKGLTEKRYHEYRTERLKKERKDSSEQVLRAYHDEAKVSGYTVECCTRSVGGCEKLECRVPLSIGIDANRGKMSTMIQQNSVVPTKNTKGFKTNGKNTRITVYEGICSMVSGNRKLAEFTLSDLAPDEKSSFDLTFEIDANGLMTVAAEFKGVGRKEITIRSRGRLSAEQVASIVKEAEDLASQATRTDCAP